MSIGAESKRNLLALVKLDLLLPKAKAVDKDPQLNPDPPSENFTNPIHPFIRTNKNHHQQPDKTAPSNQISPNPKKPSDGIQSLLRTDPTNPSPLSKLALPLFLPTRTPSSSPNQTKAKCKRKKKQTSSFPPPPPPSIVCHAPRPDCHLPRLARSLDSKFLLPQVYVWMYVWMYILRITTSLACIPPQQAEPAFNDDSLDGDDCSSSRVHT
ncbi:uncharacterized protein BO72DRAFT_42772 [Aspergillus fijiensis CBS 313.89]|uniref:Uncharacterized protein n=1 Tax=Aspergillus fijiensis CBS 313.89 TaxID=1448319 RepID=A0A8G1RSH1_9EURO|nr:uncharacterized protein BO72DRAFT_42772 [Aspergillus fijiensis CBS 313.89]RAK79387.1 hypothetical protein BO72DRAFT_42772 [Aspergillus fijiensis CBS 313.89]